MLRTECLKNFPPLDAHGLRYGEDKLVPLRSGHECQGYSGISGGRLDADESVDCLKNPAKHHCPYGGGCVFKEQWERARSSMTDIFDGTTFQDLVDKQRKTRQELGNSV
jgi:hypothetical protein